MRCAIIDVGSNTIKLNIYAVEAEIDLLVHKKALGSLASYVDQGVISSDGINMVVNQVEDFASTALKLGIENIFVIATAAIRMAVNSAEVLASIYERTGIEVELISGELEAQLGYKGLPEEYRLAGGINIDVGGGSSEILVHKNNEILFSKSMPLGCLSLYHSNVSLIFPTQAEVDLINASIDAEFEKIGVSGKFEGFDIVTAIGGTARALLKFLNYMNGMPSRKFILKSEIDDVMNGLVDGDSAMIKNVARILPERIHIISMGMLIYQNICAKLGISKFDVCFSGIMDGYVAHRFKDM